MTALPEQNPLPNSDINWVAILVATIAAFIIGGLWYSALFRSVWRRLSGLQDDQLQPGAALSYGLGFICSFIMAYVMARVVDYVLREPEQKTIGNGLLVGLLVWTGFVATTSLTTDLIGRKPLARWLVEALHFLVVLLMMGGLLAYWQ